jgi:NADH-quinone oxidoreductase subunit M
MDNMPLWLIASLITPLAGAAIIAATSALGREAARWTALVATCATLLLAAVVVLNFPAHGQNAGDYAVTNVPWLNPAETGLDARLNLGLDGLGIFLYGLSALLMVSAVLVSWEAINDRPALFYAMLLLLEFGCLGVFAARDVLLFYVFFEFTLIPLFFLIGIWGSEERRYAAIKFFLFTLAGSMLTFLGLLAIVIWHAQSTGAATLTFSIPELTAVAQQRQLPTTLQYIIFLALFAGFAIKVPLFPLHTWLPLAHVQAPAAGSVILAGILLKIGTYGFARFSIPLLPDATVACMPWVLWLSAIGIIYGALVALAQSDMKRLIAYSSVSHLGYCMLGLFALNGVGFTGGTLQMINHGLSTGGLFAIVGMLYERYHTRDIKQLGGLARRVPVLAFFMLLFTLSSIGLPGLNGFTGEILVLLGMFQRAWAQTPDVLLPQYKIIAVLAVAGVVLGAWYMLYLVQRVFFGPLKEPHHEGEHAPIRDLSLREILAVAPLAVFMVWIGLQPEAFRERMQPTLDSIIASTDQPFLNRYSPPAAAGAPAAATERLADVR